MSIGRRSMLGSAALAPLAASAAAAQPAPNPQPTPEARKPEVWHFLTSAEVRALEALVSLVIPADELGPGAKEAGVVVFLDRQLAGAWGAGAQFYRAGPFQNGTPQQGYQLALTPAEMFRTCLAKLDQSAAAQNDGRIFADSSPDQQNAIMQAMYDGKFDLAPVSSNVFFTALTEAAFEGFFSDPIYGGNRDMIGWKLVGFPGAYASYEQEVERWGIAWNREPVSIADAGHEAMTTMPGTKP